MYFSWGQGELRIHDKEKWNAAEEKTPMQALWGAGGIHLPLPVVSGNSLPTASTISLKEKETRHTYFPLLIAELKGCVIKPYMNLTT